MINYEKLKFKAGLEIHQQLNSSKLFCSCPSILRSDEPREVVKRNLHVVAGEGGKVDIAAKFQSKEGGDFFYESFDTTCLVELDEEPPHELNQEALRIGTEISLLLNCKIIPVTQVMRKTVIDGSNTSGFQRTVMISRNGFIETSKGKVGINFVLLEEDSARKVSTEKNKKTFKLDRLGIPLVEVVTAPDIKNAEHAKEVALKIGDILRISKVRRGIGTIRQDINISIRGEKRVEIKGMQDMALFLSAIEKEVLRQKQLSDSKTPTGMEVRNVLKDSTTEFLRPMPGSARMYPETDLPLLHISRDFVNRIKKNLPKLRSEIEEELRSQGLTKEMIQIMFKRNKFDLYRELYNHNGHPRIISKVLLLFPKEIASKKKKVLEEIEKILNKEVLLFVLDAVYKEKIQEKDLKHVLEKIVSGIEPKDAIRFEKKDLIGVEEEIMKLIKEKPGLRPNAYMGLIMKEMKGAIGGDEAMEIINKVLNSL